MHRYFKTACLVWIFPLIVVACSSSAPSDVSSGDQEVVGYTRVPGHPNTVGIIIPLYIRSNGEPVIDQANGILLDPDSKALITAGHALDSIFAPARNDDQFCIFLTIKLSDGNPIFECFSRNQITFHVSYNDSERDFGVLALPLTPRELVQKHDGDAKTLKKVHVASRLPSDRILYLSTAFANGQDAFSLPQKPVTVERSFRQSNVTESQVFNFSTTDFYDANNAEAPRKFTLTFNDQNQLVIIPTVQNLAGMFEHGDSGGPVYFYDRHGKPWLIGIAESFSLYPLQFMTGDLPNLRAEQINDIHRLRSQTFGKFPAFEDYIEKEYQERASDVRRLSQALSFINNVTRIDGGSTNALLLKTAICEIDQNCR